MKRKFYITICCILNLIYSFIGELLQIAYAITLPGSEKFEAGPLGNIWLLILVLAHFVGEILFLNISYQKLFNGKKAQFIIYTFINVNVYYMVLWISLLSNILY